MNLFTRIKTELNQLRRLMRNRIYVSPKTEAEVVREFHKLYYNSHLFARTFGDTKWFGTTTLKCPLDLWIYQEMLFELKPDVILETGTCEGGSALYLAHLCDLMGKGRVITIDIEGREGRPKHPRVEYWTASSVDPHILSKLRALIRPDDKVVAFLDSDHSRDHVLAELRAYREFISRGSYLVVEDTNINGHPVYPEFGPGPMEAVDEFLKEDQAFKRDPSMEKFYMTFNPKGFLKKS
jgi:cephalosporin hydroxylase